MDHVLGEKSCVEAMKDALAARDESQPVCNSFTSLADAAACLHEAEEADKRRNSGSCLSPWDGVAIGVKDNLAVEGHEFTASSAILRGFTSPYDSTAAARLRAGGAVFVGKCNMDEFGMGSAGVHSVHGRTRHPLALRDARFGDHVSGGSSSGSATAVATGAAVASLGSDTGGSVRMVRA